MSASSHQKSLQDEKDMSEPVAVETCLQDIKRWPKILELLGQSEVSFLELGESFDVLTRLLQQGNDESLPEYQSTALDVIQKLLHVHISLIYRGLSSKTISTVMSTLNLLVAMVTYSRHAAHDVLSSLNIQSDVLLALTNRRNLKVADDIRGRCLHFAMAFFIVGDNKVIKQMLTYKEFLKSFFKKLATDCASSIKLLLGTLLKYVVINPDVNKTEKLHILNEYTLLQVAALYRWKQTASETKADDEDQSEQWTTEEEIRQLCHHFLLTVTCSYKDGINFLDSTLGLSAKNCNSVLLKFILHLHHQVVEDSLVQDLIVQILHTCPDLLNHYLSSCKLSFQPRPSQAWLVNMALLEKILSGQPVVCSAIQQSMRISSSQLVHMIMTNMVPKVLTPVLLSQAIKHTNSIVSHCILRIIQLILQRSLKIITWLKTPRQTASQDYHQRAIAQYQGSLIKVLPDVDTLVVLLQKSMDQSDQGNTTGAEQMSASDVPVPSKEQVLTVLLDVLCSYQHAIPSSFAHTAYDFSCLPRSLHHVQFESDRVEERAIQLLLAFPEGKLRGFKEVKGERGSTVLLLLQQLMSTSKQSPVHSLKLKLLNKFIEETGLFAQTDWEITLWLDNLVTFDTRSAEAVIPLIYKSLTQAIRNPYPYNDRIIEAMHHVADGHPQQDAAGETPITLGLDQLPLDVMTMDLDEECSLMDCDNVQTLPCSALVPSTLQVLTQLEQPGLFSEYVSSVILSIVDRQEDPSPVCFLLHNCTTSDDVKGQALKQDEHWLKLMKYYSMWLARPYQHTALYRSVQVKPSPAGTSSIHWRTVLRESILQGCELTPSSMALTLHCEFQDLLPMARQLLMYVYTMDSVVARKNALAMVNSYLTLLERILQRVHNEQEQCAGEETEPDMNEDAPMAPTNTDSNTARLTRWWVDIAGVMLQHAAFKAMSSQPQSKQTLRTKGLVVSYLLKYLLLYKQHLTNDQLELLLEPIMKSSCDDFTDLVSCVSERKSKRKDLCEDNCVELFKEICVYGAKSYLYDAIEVLLRTLGNKEATSQRVTFNGLKDALCHLLQVLTQRHQSELHTVAETTNGTVSLDVVSLVAVAQTFRCDRLFNLLLQWVELQPQLASVFTTLTTWLEEPSKATNKLLCYLVKNSREHSKCFEEWLVTSSDLQLDADNHQLLPVFCSYIQQGQPTKDDQILSSIHSACWNYLNDWLVTTEQDTSDEMYQTKIDMLSYLVMHTSEVYVVGLIQSLVKHGRKSRDPLTRAKLTICNVAVRRYTDILQQLHHPKTGTILEDVVTVCLDSLVRTIHKKVQDPSLLEEMNEHLKCTVSIVKALGGNKLRISANLAGTWKRFIRNGLKHHYQSPDMLGLIASLVKLIYPHKHTAQSSTMDIDLSESLLPLPVLYQIVVGHSLCLPTLLKDEDEQLAKESLVCLMLIMVEMDAQCCHSAHFSVLVGAYSATMHCTDTALLMLMKHYQLNQACTQNSNLTQWGSTAISQHQSQKALGKSLWQQPTMKEILQQLEPDILQETALHFPLKRKLQVPSQEGVGSEWYDPCFLLALFSHILAPECLVECDRFIESNALFLTIAGLSSHDVSMRQASYHVLASYLGHLEGARFRGRREVYYLMQCFKNSITEPNMRIAGVVGVFVARAASLMLKPDHFMYPVLLQYLLIKPYLQTNAVPLFARLMYSSTFKHEEECLWMLTLLTDGLKEAADITLYNKSFVFTTLMSLFQSKLASRKIGESILSLLDRALDVTDIRQPLIRQLLPCLQAAVESARCDSHVATVKHSLLVRLLQKIHSITAADKDTMCAHICTSLIEMLDNR